MPKMQEAAAIHERLLREQDEAAQALLLTAKKVADETAKLFQKPPPGAPESKRLER